MALYSGWFTGKVLHHLMSDHLLPNSRMLQCPWSGCSEWLSTVDGSQVNSKGGILTLKVQSLDREDLIICLKHMFSKDFSLSYVCKKLQLMLLADQNDTAVRSNILFLCGLWLLKSLLTFYKITHFHWPDCVFESSESNFDSM